MTSMDGFNRVISPLCFLILLRRKVLTMYGVHASRQLPTPRRHSNEVFTVIISCCYVSRCPCDMLCADPLSAMELSSLMNLSRVNDSGWDNVVYKTGRRLCVGVVLMCRQCGCGFGLVLNVLTIIGGFM